MKEAVGLLFIVIILVVLSLQLLFDVATTLTEYVPVVA
jgi:hypothetical protein